MKCRKLLNDAGNGASNTLIKEEGLME